MVDIQIHRHHLAPGDEVSIIGKRGRFQYRYATESADGTVSLTFIGGKNGHFRSFRPEQVRVVHRKKVLR